jgi:hypothetical protein
LRDHDELRRSALADSVALVSRPARTAQQFEAHNPADHNDDDPDRHHRSWATNLVEPVDSLRERARRSGWIHRPGELSVVGTAGSRLAGQITHVVDHQPVRDTSDERRHPRHDDDRARIRRSANGLRTAAAANHDNSERTDHPVGHVEVQTFEQPVRSADQGAAPTRLRCDPSAVHTRVSHDTPQLHRRRRDTPIARPPRTRSSLAAAPTE